MEFLLLDIADLIFQSSYWISCLTVKNHVVEKTGPNLNNHWFFAIKRKLSPSNLILCVIQAVKNHPVIHFIEMTGK